MASLTNEASSSSSSLPRSSPNQNHYTYEVFLSFRGEDTRFNFTDHLHTALCDRGIETFIDDELRRGEKISSALVKAIEESRVSIIVFSPNYASSRWCLDELVKILDCKRSKGHEVRAIFYKVDPSDVRHQIGAFGEAFATLDRCKYKDSMGKWKAALTEAAELSGWPFKDGEYEARFIKKIVGELSSRVINPSGVLQVAANPIGVESCSQDVIRLLHADENIVNMTGIWGPGGIGKTSIAKDVFNSIRHKFEGSSFLAEVRSSCLAQLQQKLLYDILRDLNLKVDNVDQGVGWIKTKMRQKKVLIVVDDVSHYSHLENLVPSHDCFGPGSRILITTRDKRQLIVHQVDEVYHVKMLNYDRALELFSMNAFKRSKPPGDYLQLAERAVRYAQGLPLALIVLGSHLFHRSKEEWEVTIGNCKGGPQAEIQDVLRLSYEALGEDLKELFLDIACFFKGQYVNHVKQILEACYDQKLVMIGISQLQEKALIRIDVDKIWMHDLIEEMGKDIVHHESHGEPGERSRLWSEKDVNHVLTTGTGTNKVLGIQVLWQSTLSLNAKSFSGMTNLRYISMSNMRNISLSNMRNYKCFLGDNRDIDYLSNQLRWIHWPKCPLQSLPSDFHAHKLVKLSIPGSHRMRRLWEGHKKFSSLTYMDLRGCKSLIKLPDFSGIPELKKLDLSGCTSLVEVPDSIRFLHNLVACLNASFCRVEIFSKVGKELGTLTKLDLSRTCIKELHPSITKMTGLEELKLVFCRKLRTLPVGIHKLRNLKVLDASNCPELATFPEIPTKMDSLRELLLSGSGIRELDESIGNLIGLETLNLGGCKDLKTLPCSIHGLQKLESLYLSNCSKLVRFPSNTNILNVDGCSLSLPKLGMFAIAGCSSLSDCDFLVTLDCWRTLCSLDLSRNKFLSLPACISKFVNLRRLYLRDCKFLRFQEIPELPPKVKLYLSDCQIRGLLVFHHLEEPSMISPAVEPSTESMLVITSEQQQTPGQESMDQS